MKNKITKSEFIGAVAYIFLVISAFLPWVTVRNFTLDTSVSICGIEGDGKFMVVFGILGLITLIYGHMYYNRKLSAISMIIFSVLSFITLTITSRNISFGEYGLGIFVLPGTGWTLATFVSMALFVLAFFLAYSSKKDSERKRLMETQGRDRYCPECGREIPWDANVCPYCEMKFSKYVEMKNKEEEQITIDAGNKAKKADRNLLILILSLIAVVSIFLMMSSIFPDSPSNSYYDGNGDGNIIIPYVSPYHTVELEVTGTVFEGVSLHYTLDDYSMDFDYVELPWSREVSTAKEGEWYYVYAQNNDDIGWIEATIKIDGVVVEMDTSYSSYGVVSVGKYV